MRATAYTYRIPRGSSGGGGLEPKIIVRIVEDAEQCRVD